jgi:competence protein ComEC
MLPHHGSKYGACEELLDMVLPRYVIVSAGVDNKYGHPHQEVLDRLVGLHSLEDDYLLRTDTMGDIVFSSVDSELCYYTEKQGTHEKLTISFRMLTAIIAVVIIMLLFSIRPRKRRKSRAY